jgi:hypothetical protein
LRCKALVRDRGNKFRDCSNNALPLSKYCGGHLNAKKIWTHKEAKRIQIAPPKRQSTTIFLSQSQKEILETTKTALWKNGLKPIKQAYPNIDLTGVVNFSNGQIITIACRVLLKNLEAKQ